MRLLAWRRVIVLVGLVALLSAGLARGGDAAAPTTVSVTLKEFTFVPKVVTVHPGPTRFVLTNAGTMEHDFVIDSLKIKTPVIKPGQSVAVLVTLKPGTYRAYCDVPGHKELGMILSITVK